MAVIDFLTNAFTQYGFAALASEATDESAAESDVIDAGAVLGAVAPAAGVGTLIAEEPGPDDTSQRGLSLELRPFNGTPLFTGQPREDETVQGFLGNCPLVAILTAMAHIQHFRSILVDGAVVRERPMEYSTFRQRQLYEFLVNERPDPLPRVPGKDRNFEGDHVFAVNFFKDAQEATIGKRAEIFTLLGGHTITEIVSPVLYFDTDPPEGFFYAHSMRRNLWVNIIEKGFVFLHGVSTPAPTYQDINDGLDPNRAMSEVTGYSRMGLINNSGNPDIPELSAKQWRSWMKLHNTRPTIIGSLDNPANPELIVADHAFALFGFDASAHRVTLINAIEENGSPGRIVVVPFELIRANFEEIVQGPSTYGSAP